MSQPANSSAEVHAFPRRHGFNAFEQAKQELAAFKFSLFEAVAADPLLRAGQCLNLIIVYASLVTIDKKTLQATPAYASNDEYSFALVFGRITRPSRRAGFLNSMVISFRSAGGMASRSTGSRTHIMNAFRCKFRNWKSANVR